MGFARERLPSVPIVVGRYPGGISANSRGMSEVRAIPPVFERERRWIPRGSQARAGTPPRRLRLASLRDPKPISTGIRWCRRFAPQPPANGIEPSGFGEAMGAVTEMGAMGSVTAAIWEECHSGLACDPLVASARSGNWLANFKHVGPAVLRTWGRMIPRFCGSLIFSIASGAGHTLPLSPPERRESRPPGRGSTKEFGRRSWSGSGKKRWRKPTAERWPSSKA